MIELPSTRPTQHNELQNSPPHNPRIRRLRLITKLRFPFLQINDPLQRPWARALEFTLWNTCSRRISCNRAFKSCTRCARLADRSLLLLSMSPVSPTARSKWNLTWVLVNHPPALDVWKQSLCSPDSAAVNVNFPDDPDFWLITRWSLSNVSFRYILAGLGHVHRRWFWCPSWGLRCIGLFQSSILRPWIGLWLISNSEDWPTTRVSFGRSSRKQRVWLPSK